MDMYEQQATGQWVEEGPRLDFLETHICLSVHLTSPTT